MLVVVVKSVASVEGNGFDAIPKYEDSPSTYSEVISNNELEALVD